MARLHRIISARITASLYARVLAAARKKGYGAGSSDKYAIENYSEAILLKTHTRG